MLFFIFFGPSIWLNIMKRVFSFGHLKIRKRNSDAAYEIGNRILELTSGLTCKLYQHLVYRLELLRFTANFRI